MKTSPYAQPVQPGVLPAPPLLPAQLVVRDIILMVLLSVSLVSQAVLHALQEHLVLFAQQAIL
mgnify:CR=1 FL=1